MYGGVVRDSRLYTEHLALLFGVHIHIFPHFRARPHQTHVAFQHVPQLRQFVQLVSAQEVAELGNAFVAFSHGNQPLLVRPRPHGAELIQAKGVPVLPYTLLNKESGPFALKSYQNIDDAEYW